MLRGDSLSVPSEPAGSDITCASIATFPKPDDRPCHCQLWVRVTETTARQRRGVGVAIRHRRASRVGRRPIRMLPPPVRVIDLEGVLAFNSAWAAVLNRSSGANVIDEHSRQSNAMVA
jgi:hypothetical protein